MPRVAKTTSEKVSNYTSNGIFVSPAIPTSGDKIRVVYDGLLAKSGATDVFAHVGFGNKWDNIYDYRMDKTEMGFQTTIPVFKSGSLNMAFKDCANNWDNNSGMNYIFEIS